MILFYMMKYTIVFIFLSFLIVCLKFLIQTFNWISKISRLTVLTISCDQDLTEVKRLNINKHIKTYHINLSIFPNTVETHLKMVSTS